MSNLLQERAVRALKHVKNAAEKDDTYRQKYRTYVSKMGALIHTAGLLHAVEFMASRKDDAANEFLANLQVQIEELSAKKDIRTLVRSAPLSQYTLITREILLCLEWYRTFVETVFPKSDK